MVDVEQLRPAESDQRGQEFIPLAELGHRFGGPPLGNIKRATMMGIFGETWMVVFFVVIVFCGGAGFLHIIEGKPLADLMMPLVVTSAYCDLTLVGLAWHRGYSSITD